MPDIRHNKDGAERAAVSRHFLQLPGLRHRAALEPGREHAVDFLGLVLLDPVRGIGQIAEREIRDVSLGAVGERLLEGDVLLSLTSDVSNMSCLCEVGQTLGIYTNPDLVDLSGLESVSMVGGDLARETG